MANWLGYLLSRYSSLGGTAKTTNTTCGPANEPFIDEDDTSGLRANNQEVADPSLKHLPVQIDRLRNSNGRLGYFSLPREVRNKIMRYALIPGQIHPHRTSSFTPKSPIEKASSWAPKLAHIIIKDSKWSTKMPKRLPQILKLLELLLQYTFVFHPQYDIEARLIYCMDNYALYVLCYLADWNIRCGSRQMSWREFADPMMEYLYEQVPKRPSTEASACESRPIPQLLATCKKAYVEGHVWFYTHNMFFLPRGPTWITRRYFEELQEQHRSLIQAVGIRLGIGDLTAEDLDDVELLLDDFLPSLFRSYHSRNGFGAERSCSSRLVDYVMGTFTEKIGFVRHFFPPTLKQVRLETAYATVELDGSSLQQSLEGIHDYLYYETVGNETVREVQNLLDQAYTELQNLLSQRIRQYGWSSTKRWLSSGADGQI
jgi:hypothetical protein